MKRSKFISLLLTVFCLGLLLAFSACGSNDGDSQNQDQSGTTTQKQDTTAANGTEDTNDPVNEGTNVSGEDVKINVTSPAEDAEVSGGKVTVSGSAEGEVTEVKVTMILADETVVGEGKALVADVSHEFTTDVSYTIPEEKKDDNGVDCKIKLLSLDKDGKELKDSVVHVNLKP
ncbi:MAG: hypothetical protein Q4C00_01770 [Bacillota bacterium]|nr:hypothetical protein [Bacillota bacterium]